MNGLLKGIVETLQGSWAPPRSRLIELIFHADGEATNELALQLALEYIKPNRAHVIHDVAPRQLAVRGMLGLDYRGTHVVSVAANCLILEDLRPFLDANELPFVDCFGRDRFRGRARCGVHITRVDVLRAMRTIREPNDNLSYILSPEEYRRQIALRQFGFSGVFKTFDILSDYFQRAIDIFTSCALWGLRNRTELGRRHLAAAMSAWGRSIDFEVARRALEHVASALPTEVTSRQVERYIEDLPVLAKIEVQNLGIDPDHGDHISIEAVRAVASDHVVPEIGAFSRTVNRPKVFGIGLSRTGTHSLTEALHVLGFDTVHYPIDGSTLETLLRGDTRFPLLAYYDGITDITASPYYEDLDHEWPGSKFVLTVRDENSWLSSCRKHWSGLSNFRYGDAKEHRVFTEIRRFLEAAVYGCFDFHEERFRRVYRRHVQNVISYFAGREDDLLVLDVVAGDGYERLARFLNVPGPDLPFPHGGTKGKRALSDSAGGR